MNMRWIVDKNHIVDEETPGLIIASMNLLRNNWQSNANLIVESVNKQSPSPLKDVIEEMEKIRELVEATLVIGARRANDSLTHETAKPLIEKHIESLSKRFMQLVSENDTSRKEFLPKLKQIGEGSDELWGEVEKEAKRLYPYDDGMNKIDRDRFLDGGKFCLRVIESDLIHIKKTCEGFEYIPSQTIIEMIDRILNKQ